MKHIPPPPAAVTALIALYNTRRYPEAESLTRALLRQYPDFGFGWKLLGGVLQAQDKDALPAFQKVVDLMPNDAEAHYNLGVILKSSGQPAAAVTSYRRAIKLKPDYAEAHSNLGNTLKDLGRLDAAITHYRRALKIQPNSADTHNNLGTALKDLSTLNKNPAQLDAALASYRQAVALKPDFALAHYNLGNAQKEQGQLDDAVSSYRRAIQINPDFTDAHTNLGSALQDLGQFDAALGSYQRVLELKPNFAEAHNNLGVVLKDLGQLDAASASYRKAIELKPEYAEAHNNLGNALQSQKQLEAALASYRRAVEIAPDFAEAHSNLGYVLKESGQFSAAVNSCRQAITIKPDFAEAYNNLGIALKELGQFSAAQLSYGRAIHLKPDFPEAHNNLGSVLTELGKIEEAIMSYRRAIELKPDYAEAHSNLGIVLKDIGQYEQALAEYRRARDLKPEFLNAQSNLLFTLNYTAQTPQNCREEARSYGEMANAKVTSRFSTWLCSTHPTRLRVGLVSGDLHNHPVGHFLEGLLAQLDPLRVELIAYSADPLIDELTIRIKPYFASWKTLLGLNDEAAARLIHADGVHVLLDLSGHTGKNRLPTFAWKPAPVQASWLGYFATTGVTEMDYLLADEVGVPELQRGNFSETIWYLPDTRLCFTPPATDLPVAALPALKNDHLTFGCFQNLAKINDDILSAWGTILTALPTAKLRWQCKQLGDPAIATHLTQRVQQHGISPTRISLHGTASREKYLAAHAEVDAILDTFPYPGGTTTCEALWMGVPTLTLAGDSLLARQGASLLTAAGLEEWVTDRVEDYIDQAVTLTRDLDQLSRLRGGLREQVRLSPLFDAKRFARHFEAALWGMWAASNKK
jgi:protein O-GlcNAc transferase